MSKAAISFGRVLPVLLASFAAVAAVPPEPDHAVPPGESAQLASASQLRRSRGRLKRPRSYKVTAVANGGAINGTITYKGKQPAARKIQIVKDQETCGRHPTEVPLMRVDGDGRVAEAVVYLIDISEGKPFAAEEKKPKINQETCEFHPHIQAVRAKSAVQIVNSDPVAHNINASQRIYTLFNILQPQQGMTAEREFSKPGVVNLKCNVHEWMQAYVHVFLHPYYHVTGDDGAFALENIPPGKYKLGVWQEYLGEQVFDVDVKAGETTKFDVELKDKEGEAN